jgi:hypothetical protein
VSVGKYFDFENFDYYHHVSDEFKMMDIGHMTHFIQEMLPAMTKMANSPTQEIHDGYWRYATHIVII